MVDFVCISFSVISGLERHERLKKVIHKFWRSTVLLHQVRLCKRPQGHRGGFAKPSVHFEILLLSPAKADGVKNSILKS